MRTSTKSPDLRRRLNTLIFAAALSSLAVVATAQEDQQFWDDSQDAMQRAQDLLGQMTLDEKVDMLHGELVYFNLHNEPIERLGIPEIDTVNGPAGVRIVDPDVTGPTQLPAPTALAATWNPELAQEYGALAGREAYLSGYNALLAPVLDVLRVPQFGRAFETYGEDPLLIGTLGAAMIRGVQSNPGVLSGPKHYTAYTQETHRNYGGNVIIDERTLQEIYVRPVAIAIRHGRPGSLMCSFNKVNGVYLCEHEELLTGILKNQLDFQGWVLTDYASAQSTVPAVLAGLDQELPGNINPEQAPGDCFFCGPLLDAVESGEVPESRIDDAVLRILRPMFALGLFDNPAPTERQPIPVEDYARGLAIAEQAIVLLKNDAATLPLGSDVTSIAVIGADADIAVKGGGSAMVEAPYMVGPLEAIRERAGEGVRVEHSAGSDPVTSAAMLPGPDFVPSGFLTPASAAGGTGEGQGEDQGLRVEYFLNQNFEGAPAIDRIEPYAGINGGLGLARGLNAQSPHFPLQPPDLQDGISARWTGQITAPVTGTYEFALTTTGTSQLYIDDELVASTQSTSDIHQIGGKSGEVEVARMVSNTGPVEFEAGSIHTVRIEYVDDAPGSIDVGSQFKFGWIPPEGVVAPQAQAAADLARNSDVAVVVVRDYQAEATDNAELDLPNGQAELIRQVAAANPRTIVVLTTGAVVQTSDWDSAVPALLQAWYGGQDQGTAIARVLFGDVNPSGKLPVTYPVDEATMPVSAPEQFPGGGPGAGLDQQFSEGIFVGYRGYEERGLTPRYAFGHGLSYTTFEYSKLRITGGAPAAGSTAPATPLETTVTVRNTGAVAGTETVQVYAGKLPTEVPTTPKSLAGWGKVTLEPGASQDIAIQLDPQSLSYWDVEADAWQTPIGEVPIYVGSSSADIRLEGVGNSAPIAVMATAPPEAGKRQRRDVPSSLQSIRDQ